MYELAGYEILEKVYEGSRTVAYRAKRLSDQQIVILKTLRESEFPSFKDVAALQHEYKLLKKFSAPEIVRTLDLVKDQNNWVLVLEDTKGITLKKFLHGKPINLSDFFKIALQLVDILTILHQNKVIHKDIKPDNISISPDDLSIKIIDFSISSEVSSEMQSPIDLETFEGTLAYISPEQTGRMNRTIDYRSDFYSLGVTFYKMLTGKLPFKSTDPIGIVHSHLAKKPPALTDLRPEIPRMLSNFVMKLLAKNAEDRYASDIGLKSDLAECARQWNEYSDISDFKLGGQDLHDHLNIPQKLYGRKRQIKELISAFKRISQGGTELMLITGYAGIGKSSLMNELERPILRKRGYFISGKFDQLQRSMPYSGIISAFNQLVADFLTESEDKLKDIKQSILDALGNNGQVILNVIPEMEKIIGKQAAIQEVGGVEAQNRFNLMFQSFVFAIAKPEHPLVLFLDDLQWVDTASLKLIENLITACQYFFLVGAYRDNEVTAYHPLSLTLNTIEKAEIPIHHIHLNPLNVTDINRLLADILNQSKDEVQALAEIVFNKTHGNPLFVNTFIKSIYQTQLLKFSYEENKWKWNSKRIADLNVTDNVVDLITNELHRLPEEVKSILTWAACIGSIFDLHTLALVSNKSHKEIVDLLAVAIEQGFILPLGDSYKQAELLDSVAEDGDDHHAKYKVAIYKFVHDRIQQAAYHLINENVLQTMHLKIARLLKHEYAAEIEKNDEMLFNVLSHFNKAADLIETKQERIEMAEYNLLAGLKAKKSNAYGVATSYFNSGLAFMDKSAWTSHHQLMFQIYKELAECKSLTGELKTAEIYYNVLLVKARNKMEKSEIYRLMMLLYYYLSRHKDVIKVGRQALQLFNFKIPYNPGRLSTFLTITKVKLEAKLYKIDENPPLVKDPDLLRVMDILAAMQFSAYQINFTLFATITCKLIHLSLKHGFSKQSAFACIAFAIILIFSTRDFKNAMFFSQIGINLSNKFGDNALLAKVYTLYPLALNFWKNPLPSSLDYIKKAYQYAIESGELFWAVFNRTLNAALLIVLGRPISEIGDRLNKNLEFMRRVKEVEFYKLALFGKRCLEVYRDKRRADLSDLENELQIIKKNNSIIVYMGSAILVSLAAFFQGNTLKALEILENLYSDRMLLRNIMLINMLGLVLFTVLMSIHYADVSHDEQREYLKTIKFIKKMMKLCYEQHPGNFKAMYCLVSAELCVIKNQLSEAERLYDEAIAEAQKNDYKQYVAMANERAAQLYLRENRPNIARIYIREAHYAYLDRGVIAKVKLMEKQYAKWLAPTMTGKKTKLEETTIDSSMFSLDLLSVLKATQAISSEIILDVFLQKMMRIVLENAGAERGFLLIESGGKWVVAAEGDLESNKIVSSQMQPIDTREDLPVSLIMYVKRTHEDIVVNDAKNAGNLVRDDYIAKYQPKSILCMPIVHRGKLSAILYLENNLTTDAFTTQRLKVLELLASQAAISLENARIYTASGRFVPYEFLNELNKLTLADVQLGDQIQRTMSIMFCDVRGFTGISEKFSSAETFKFINDFFGRMEPVIDKYDGFIDKYIGDAIMALFDNNPDDALKAAIDMIDSLNSFNEERESHKKLPITVGIGINTGELMLGIIGDQHRMESSVIGDAVNIAARVEKLTRYYNVWILITNNTKDKLKKPENFSLRLIDEVAVRGKQKSVDLWEIFDVDPPALKKHKLETRDIFDQARALYLQKKYEEAKKLFEECVPDKYEDTVVNIYIQNCDRKMRSINKNKLKPYLED